ncbi:MAG: glycosyltransferase family 1 protein [Proteobacteria bacterium]|nr:glycosyltransferase family 1 protein [Pseudomonadota bacterium]
MSVLYDASIFASQKFGGISRYFVELIKGIDSAQFKDNDCSFSVRLPPSVHINHYLKDIASQQSKFSKCVHVPPFRNTGVIRHAVNDALLGRFLKKTKIDIYHDTFYQMCRYKIPHGVKKCVTVYDFIHELFSDSWRNSKGDGFADSIKQKHQCIREADLLFCISDSTKSDLMNILGLSEDRIVVTHLASSLMSNFDLPINKVKQDVPQGRPYVLFVGQRGWYKNFMTLLNAFGLNAQLKLNFDLMVFGGGSFTTDESNEISRLGLTENIRLRTGGDHELIQAYAGASVFCFPSKYEGFGIPLLEAFDFDVPSVVADIPVFREVAGSAAVFFDKDSPEDCANALLRILGSVSLQSELKNSMRNQRQKYSWGKTTELTSHGYLRLI